MENTYGHRSLRHVTANTVISDDLLHKIKILTNISICRKGKIVNKPNILIEELCLETGNTIDVAVYIPCIYASVVVQVEEFLFIKRYSNQPAGLRFRSLAACLLRLWVQIPPGGVGVCPL